jgi:hypothetical protein
MAKIFQTRDDAGNLSNWQYYSEETGTIVDAGADEEIARAMAEGEPEATIGEKLEGKADEIKVEVKKEKEKKGELVAIDGGRKDEEPKKRPALSPQFIAKIKERAASGCAEIGIELERFMIARFGFSTEEMEDDDPDFELLKLGWELQWGYWLAGKEPPAWVLIAFGQVCCTLRLIATAKRIPKKDKEDGTTASDGKPGAPPDSGSVAQ